MSDFQQGMRRSLLPLVICILYIGGALESGCADTSKGTQGKKAIAQTPVKLRTVKTPNSSGTKQGKKPAVVKPESDFHGAGIVVGEPVFFLPKGETAPNDTASLVSFGAACSRWLQLNVGGQGELEQTPLWSSVEASRREMKKADWRLTIADATGVRRMLGVTHVALGTIANATEPDNYELKYQVVDADNPKSPKPPAILTLKGTKAEILAQLPAQAIQLSKMLGAKLPQTPASIGIDADAMTLLGKGGWVYAEKVTPDEIKQIGSYASHEPLAALLALEYNDREGVDSDWEYRFVKGFGANQSFMDSELKRILVDDLMAKLPENSLSQAEICNIDPNQILPYYKQLDALNHKYPYNYALGTARILVELSKGNKAHLSDMARAVNYGGYRNPYTWLLMGQCLSYIASIQRGGRIASLISEDDWKFINSYYKEWQIVTRRAASFDPQNIEAWKSLAEAATFNGDEVTADGAFWKAYKLDPDDLENLRWGLQMYQPKWGGDPDKLAKIIAASKTPSHIVYLGDDIVLALNAIDEPEQAKAVEQQTSKELDNQFLPHQHDFWPALRLAGHTHSGTDYVRLVSLRYNSSATHWLMAMTEAKYSPQSEIGYYLTAIRLDPRNPLLRRELATAYVNNRSFQEGADQLEIYLKEAPFDIRSYTILGLAYYYLDKADKSLAAYSKVIELRPQTRDPDVFTRLCDLQTQAGQINKALENGRKAIEPYPDVATIQERAAKDPMSNIQSDASWAYAFYGWALFKSGHTQEAIQRCQQALEFSEVNAAAHECLGDIYLAQNKQEKAREQWELAVRYGASNSEGPRRGTYYHDLAVAQLKKYAAPAPVVTG